MGKQVNFYMTESDEQDFLRFLRSDCGVRIFMDAAPSDRVKPIESLPEKDLPGWSGLWLWDGENSPTPKMDYIVEQGYYMVDSFTSEVIEFLRSFMDNGRLVRGRIWAEMDYWTEGEFPRLCKKSISFQKWFDRLTNWIKRRSIRNDVGDYLLPGAAAYVRDGGRIVQVVFGNSSEIDG